MIHEDDMAAPSRSCDLALGRENQMATINSQVLTIANRGLENRQPATLQVEAHIDMADMLDEEKDKMTKTR